MPQRSFANPAPKTESAREARKSFFCDLCQKGYSRMNEYEAHESSYDHQHKKRLKEMKQMQRDPNASDKARRAERRADEKSGLISIKPIKIETKSAAAGTGFKKGGFKSAFGGSSTETTKPVLGVVEAFKDEQSNEPEKKDLDDSEDFDYEYYDPKRPTGCSEGCLKAA